MKYNEYVNAVKSYLTSMLSSYGINNSSSSIFNQIINVVGSVTQNILSYIDDSVTEQNKTTATRKRSIFNLASQSGYIPSLGTATSAVMRLSFKPSSVPNYSIVIPNHTRVRCNDTGMIYNVILTQEAITLSPNTDNTSKYITIVEGKFETQRMLADGGPAYTINVSFNGDSDLDYTTVLVNDREWERVTSMYDMVPEGEQYVIAPSLKNGVDITFGNTQYGKELKQNDQITVTYLLHSGEYGNINTENPVSFTFEDDIYNIYGEVVPANDFVEMCVESNETVSSGTFSEEMSQTRNMIGLNSRSFVMADARNYQLFLSRYGFVGFNRTWSEPGSMIVNSIVLRNLNITKGEDYFSLNKTDFLLSDAQKQSIKNAVNASGTALAGTIYNIFDPELCAYAMWIYITPKDDYDASYIRNEIRARIGKMFSDITDDRFIPKSDIIALIQDIDGVDSVDIYILSERNEQALMDRHYTDKTYTYNPVTGTYNISEEETYLYDGENPHLGLDDHGNIRLKSVDQFPILSGGWQYQYVTSSGQNEIIMVDDPVTIVFQ